MTPLPRRAGYRAVIVADPGHVYMCESCGAIVHPSGCNAHQLFHADIKDKNHTSRPRVGWGR